MSPDVWALRKTWLKVDAGCPRERSKVGLSETTINYPLSSPVTGADYVLFHLLELQLSFLFSAAWSLPMAIPVYRVVVKAKQNDIFNISEPEVMLKILSNKYNLVRDLSCTWPYG